MKNGETISFRRWSFLVKIGSVAAVIIILGAIQWNSASNKSRISFEKLSTIPLKERIREFETAGWKAKELIRAELFDSELNSFKKEEEIEISLPERPKVIVMNLEKSPKKKKWGALRLESTNSILCPDRGNKGCIFLFVGEVSEEGSLGESQVYQLGLLAASLGRILVLPNVGNSRFGSCESNNFSYYYSRRVFSNFGINAITHDQFEFWQRSQTHISTQAVILASESISRDGAFQILSNVNHTLEAERLCIDSSKLHFGEWATLRFSPPPPDEFARADAYFWSESLLSSLTSPLVVQETYLGNITNLKGSFTEVRTPAVLVLSNLFASAFLSPLLVKEFSNYHPPKMFSSFSFSPQWSIQGTKIAERISPFVAVHWEANKMNSTTTQLCTTSLLTRIKKMKLLYPTLSHIYLSGAVENFLEDESTTLKSFGLKVTTFAKESQVIHSVTKDYRKNSNNEEGSDPGVRRLLEKAIAARSEIFLTSAGACGNLSEFSEAVAGSRRVRRNQIWSEEGEEITPGKAGHPWQGVSHFSLEVETD